MEILKTHCTKNSGDVLTTLGLDGGDHCSHHSNLREMSPQHRDDVFPHTIPSLFGFHCARYDDIGSMSEKA